MNNVQQKPSLKGRLYCSVFGHNFSVSKKVTYHIKEYKCCHCKKEMTINSKGYLTDLTPKYKEINSVLERIHQNKLTRYSNNQIVQSPVLKMTS